MGAPKLPLAGRSRVWWGEVVRPTIPCRKLPPAHDRDVIGAQAGRSSDRVVDEKTVVPSTCCSNFSGMPGPTSAEPEGADAVFVGPRVTEAGEPSRGDSISSSVTAATGLGSTQALELGQASGRSPSRQAVSRPASRSRTPGRPRPRPTVEKRASGEGPWPAHRPVDRPTRSAAEPVDGVCRREGQRLIAEPERWSPQVLEVATARRAAPATRALHRRPGQRGSSSLTTGR